MSKRTLKLKSKTLDLSQHQHLQSVQKQARTTKKNIPKVVSGKLKVLEQKDCVPLQQHVIGSWLTQDWKMIKTWALDSSIAKEFISKDTGQKETLDIVNSLFGNFLVTLFDKAKAVKRQIREKGKAWLTLQRPLKVEEMQVEI